MCLSAALVGCTSTPDRPGYHGQSETYAGFDGSTLRAELPHTVPVPSVAAAAETVLRSRGYTVTASETTRDRARVVARTPDGKLLRKINIGVGMTSQGTRVLVKAHPASEATSRYVLESMLTRLGL